MKKTILTSMVALTILLSVCFAGPALAYGESVSSTDITKYEIEYHRVYKTALEGKYVFSDNPDYYFEIYDEFAVLSGALYDSQGITGGYRDAWATLVCFKAITWLSFVTSYSNDGGGSFTNWRTFVVYTSDIAEPETFYVEGSGDLPWERQVYKKALDDTNKPTIEERMSFNADVFSNNEVSMAAKNIFPQMGDCLYKLEIEKVIGNEIFGYRDKDGIPYAGFEYKGYRFEYRLMSSSYDILPDTMVSIKPPAAQDYAGIGNDP